MFDSEAIDYRLKFLPIEGGESMKKYVSLTLALVVVTATLASAGVHVVAGPGTGGNTIPFWPSQPGMRWQTIWHKADINEGGAVTKVEFQAYRISTASTFTTCKVLLCHTSLAHVTTSYVGNYSGKTPVTVFSGTKVVPVTAQGQWWTVVDPTNFTYNNSDNLLIEVSWVSGSPSTVCHCYINSRGKAGRVYAYSATASSGTVTANYDQLGRITIRPTAVSPTSLGRIKGLYN
jgi:hypothetical protein